MITTASRTVEKQEPPIPHTHTHTSGKVLINGCNWQGTLVSKDRSEAPFAIREGACGLRKWCKLLVLKFIGLPRKPSYSASFLHWIFLLSYPHAITLYIFDIYVNSRRLRLPFEYPGSAWAGPRHLSTYWNLFLFSLLMFYSSQHKSLSPSWSGLFLWYLCVCVCTRVCRGGVSQM